MKRKELCCFLAFVMLCQPMQIYAKQTDVSEQTEIQSETDKQLSVESLLGELSVGIDLVEGNINIADTDDDTLGGNGADANG